MRIQLTGYLDGKKIQEIPLKTTINLNDELKVEVTWSTRQMVAIKIGEVETDTVKIPWAVSNATIAGSTGQIKVEPLTFGTVGL